MGFLDDLGKSLNKMGKKTSEMANSAKLKLEITKNKSNIDKKYEELGARIYFLSKEGLNHDESVDKIIADIDQLNLNIVNLEKEIEAIAKEDAGEMLESCRNCGSDLTGEEKFCAECGTPIEEVVDEAKTCPNCEAEVGDAKFCNSCGTSLE